MPFNLPDINIEVTGCIYKLYYGDRYVIVKARVLAGSIYVIERGYATFNSAGGGTGRQRGGIGQKEWGGKNPLYTKLYMFLNKNPQLSFRLEILLESDNPYNLLKYEQQELNKCIRDKKCLNTNVVSYIPKYRKDTQSYGWISKAHVLCFKKFLKQPLPIDVNSR